ncbi:MAG: hypothetical protein ABI548_21205 [Polyangiaceae bacterium]
MQSGICTRFNFAFQSGALGHVVPVDVSQYTGVTFWAKLTSFDPQVPQIMRVQFPNADTDTEHQSTCISSKLPCDAFGLVLPGLGESWQKVSLTWDQLTQSASEYGQLHPPSFNEDVYSVGFVALGAGPEDRALPFEFCVSQIYFTQ